MTDPGPQRDPGWYPDPTGRHELRYWHGSAWTDAVADRGAIASDPPIMPPPASAALPDATPGTSPGTTLTVSSPAEKRPAWWVLVAAATVVVVLLGWTVSWFVWLRPGPGPVRLAAPTVTSSSVSLTWSRPASGAVPAHYVIRRDGMDVATIGAVTSYRDADLKPLTAYHYRVVGVVGGQRTRPTAELVVRTHPAAPTAATTGKVTMDSVVLSWSAPQGVAPERYVVLRDGKEIARVPAGTRTYRDGSLPPGASFSYSVIAVTRGQRSDASAEVKVTTLTPPVPDARLQDSWDVTLAVTNAGKSRLKVGDREVDSWAFTPSCATGPCSVSLSATFSDRSYKVALKRHGAVYQGSAKVHLLDCAGAAVTNTVAVTAKVTRGQMRGGSWVASRWTGTVVLSSPYTRSGNYYCPVQSIKFSATPGSSTPARTT